MVTHFLLQFYFNKSESCHIDETVDDAVEYIGPHFSESLSQINTRLSAMEKNIDQNSQTLRKCVESTVKMEKMLEFVIKHIKTDTFSKNEASLPSNGRTFESIRKREIDDFERQFKVMETVEDIDMFDTQKNNYPWF